MSVFTFKKVRDLVLLEGLVLIKSSQVPTVCSSTMLFILSSVVLFILQVLPKRMR